MSRRGVRKTGIKGNKAGRKGKDRRKQWGMSDRKKAGESQCGLVDLEPTHYLGVITQRVRGLSPGEGQHATFGIHLNPFLGWLKSGGDLRFIIMTRRKHLVRSC